MTTSTIARSTTAIAEALGLPPEGLIPRIRQFRDMEDLGGNLASLGVTEALLPELVQRTLEDPCLVTNPRQPRADEVAQLFREAL